MQHRIQGRAVRRHAVISAGLVMLCAGLLAAPAGAAVHRSKRAKQGVAHSRSISFYATVVHASAKGLVVRTRSGKTLTFSAAELSHKRSAKHRGRHVRRHVRKRAHVAIDPPPQVGPVAVDIIGLQPGATVLITETVGPGGKVTVTITLPPSSVVGQKQASGVVTDVEDDSFKMTTSDGTGLRLGMASDALSNLNLESCDTVAVTYHQDAGMLIADGVQVTGAADTGNCAPTYDATGPITQVSDTSITIASDQGATAFAVSDPSLTECFAEGDVVDVTYTENGDGSLSATSVQFVEQDASGTVSAVSSTSLTITDDETGQPDKFVADPGEGLQLSTDAFTGLKVGDRIDVTYHRSAAGNVADTVGDEPGDS